MNEPRNSSATSQTRGGYYTETIQANLAEERATKASLEQRGVTIVTTSGVLATLLFGFSAFVYGSKVPVISNEGMALLITSVTVFALAAACGLAANRPAFYREASIERLRNYTEPEEWSATDASEGARLDAQSVVSAVEAYRTANSSKAVYVYVGTCIETFAVSCVASALTAILGGCDAATEALAIIFVSISGGVLIVSLVKVCRRIRNQRSRGEASTARAGEQAPRASDTV